VVVFTVVESHRCTAIPDSSTDCQTHESNCDTDRQTHESNRQTHNETPYGEADSYADRRAHRGPFRGAYAGAHSQSYVRAFNTEALQPAVE
jgi:hypothetical protein